jgi:putative GTP pyrophosphokinase
VGSAGSAGPGEVAPLLWSATADGDPCAGPDVATLRQVREEFVRFMMAYRFAVDEVITKVSILREEFTHLHRYNPIEHVTSRVKSPASILDKVARRGLEPTFETIRANITDIAGVRITCSFIADTYRMLEILTAQTDVRVITVKDYIATPKPNGYKSLHAIVEIPVFLSDGPVPVTVEVQIRTIAMDFWASLEHKIYYKYDGEVPAHLAESLSQAAQVAEQMDHRMEELHAEVHAQGTGAGESAPELGIDDEVLRQLLALSRVPR